MKPVMKYIVSRAINGIGINGDEYLQNSDGLTYAFETKDIAKGFLLVHGESEENADTYNYTQIDIAGKEHEYDIFTIKGE